MKSLHKFRHGLDTVLSWVCALLFAAMVVVDHENDFHEIIVLITSDLF